MNKSIWILFLIIMTPCILLAYENCMLNLDVPSVLDPGQMRFQIQHRFYGETDDRPGETFFGVFDKGANTALGLKAAVVKHVGVFGAYISEGKEYQLGASWDFTVLECIQSQVSARYFSFRPTIDKRESNVFYQIAFQSKPLMKKMTPVADLGYDGYRKRFGLGMGLCLDVLDNVGLMAETYPSIDSDGQEMKSSFALGFRIRTYGHYFIFVLGNSYHIGTRQLMYGAPDKHLHLGFTIQRLLEL